MCFGRDSKAGKGVGKLCSGKRERLQICPVGGYGHGGAASRLTVSRASHAIGWGAYLTFSFGPKLEEETKIEEAT